MEKWRGIKTSSVKVNEKIPKTIINRFNQKSLSLPRIDDKKRLAGYGGLTGISRKLSKIIPECKFYVEPFAGTAKVYQELGISKYQYAILNDKSKFIYEWLSKEFNLANVTNDDFIKCILEWDSKKTIFVIDQPWFKTFYDQSFSCFDRNSIKDYDNEILDLCRNIKGKFFITTRKENSRMLNSEFYNFKIESEYVVCGNYPKVLITTNFNKHDLFYNNFVELV